VWPFSNEWVQSVRVETVITNDQAWATVRNEKQTVFYLEDVTEGGLVKNNDEICNWPTLKQFPPPVKVLVTAIILTMAVGMVGALAQIVVHDIIPTFISSDPNPKPPELPQAAPKNEERGDLFANPTESSPQKIQEPFYRNEQFIWMLKWTHIHLFGMSGIFILTGAVVMFLDIGTAGRAWLIALPFLGIWIDIASMWLRGFISPAFFWLHIPGGGLFGAIFVFVLIRGLYEMWFATPSSLSKAR
jgi:hypothetical protein